MSADHRTAGAGLDDAQLAALRQAVPPERLSTDAVERAAHARDCWPRLMMQERAGQHPRGPDAVAWPADHDEVVALYRWAGRHGVPLVPFGGGGGVCGAAAAPPGTVAVDTKRMSDIGPLDPVSGLVTVQPGVIGQNLEDWLAQRGWTLGHFPSSVTLSSVGGFAAARSAGQASTKYGTFADMVAGLTAVLPDGTSLSRRPRPASAAGPDLAGLLVGGEGAFGTITELVLRVHPQPDARGFDAWRFAAFTDGLEALRTVLQQGLRPSVLRLYDPTDTSLAHPDMDGCLLLAVTEGYRPLVEVERAALDAAAAAAGAEAVGAEPARHWYAHRYDVSYRLADALKPGGMLGDASLVDTMELAAPWGVLAATYEAVAAALAEHVDLVGCHASHAYSDGACLYFTLAGVGDGDEVRAQRRYEAAWGAAMDAALASGATITHHHGVGRLRGPWLDAELGAGGRHVLAVLRAGLDPAGVANPGALGGGGW